MLKLNKIEALRGIAALYVLIHHFNIGEGTWVKYFTQQGQMAVILFFLVSGFVIHVSNHHVIHEGKLSFKKYFIKRFRRIYPVLLVSLLISYLALCLSEMKWVGLNGFELFVNIINLQDLDRHPGCWEEAFAGNTPLWSLSYEWWFYMMFFPIARYVPMKFQRYLAISIFLFGFLSFWILPNQVSIIFEYFIIWWIGVELGKAWKEKHLLNKQLLIYIYSSLGVLIGLQFLRLLLYKERLYPSFNPYKYPDYSGKWDIAYYPLINILHSGYAIFLLTVGLIWYKLKLWGFKHSIGYFSFFAPISYSIYVFHYPLVMRYKFPIFDSLAMQYSVCLIVLFLLCYLVEVKLQHRINLILR